MNKYFAVLGLPATASKDEIRRKYRQLVLIWHPDRNPAPEAHAKFIALTEAYDILMGERPAPRARTTYTYTTPKQKVPRQKPASAQRQDTRASHDDLLRRKFEGIRSEYLRAHDREARKKNMYRTAYFLFGSAATLVLLCLSVPLLFSAPGHLTWTLPCGIGAGMILLWRGGRYKLRADMIFSGRNNYTMADIKEFFVETAGFDLKEQQRW